MSAYDDGRGTIYASTSAEQIGELATLQSVR